MQATKQLYVNTWQASPKRKFKRRIYLNLGKQFRSDKRGKNTTKQRPQVCSSEKKAIQTKKIKKYRQKLK